MRINTGLPFLLFFLVFYTAKAQFNIDSSEVNEYYSDNFMRYDNHNYHENVRTVTLHPTGWPLGPAVINLNDESTLELHFDVLDSTLGNYMYSLIHCDYNWQPSELDVQEYIDGPPEDYLTDYDYSRNTFQKYIHYRLEIPNFSMRITKSGNYLVRVYEDGDQDALILTRRFCVTEEALKVEANVHQATRVKERYSHQEVDFTISTTNYPLTNPYTDLKVVILQNHTWENAVSDLQPRFMKDQLLDYNYDGENTFPGLNEYRLLDIKNTRFTGQGVENISYTNQQNHAYLELNKSRSSKVYLQRPDINGWYFIKNDWLNTQGDVDADYVNTHFRLAQDRAETDGDIYIYGALTDWQIKPEAKMQFNQLELEYQATMYIKQGLYNYLYVYVQDGALEPEMTRYEGSHFQTENEYAILVYHRQLGWDFDRLLSYTVFKFPPEE